MRAGVHEVEEAGASIKLGEEERGIGLGLGALDPLQARADGASIAASLPQHPAPITAHPYLSRRLYVNIGINNRPSPLSFCNATALEWPNRVCGWRKRMA